MSPKQDIESTREESYNEVEVINIVTYEDKEELDELLLKKNLVEVEFSDSSKDILKDFK